MNRREFIGASAVGAATWTKAMAQEGPAKEFRVALIGCGAQGRVLMNALREIPGVKFVAICDIWEYSQRYVSRYLMKFGHEVRVYEDYNELLENADDVDACFVATPDFMHAPVANACLKAGKPTYCEKMMSNTLEGAKSMVTTMKETKQLLQIGHQRRSNPRYIHVKNNLIDDANIFKRLMYANAQWNRGISEPNTWPKKYVMSDEKLEKYGYKDMNEFRNWRWYKKYGGGPVSDLGAHQIDILHWFFGTMPKSIMVSAGTDYYDGYEHDDAAMLIYEYDTEQGPARAFYQVLTTTSSLGFMERFMGVDATLTISENPRWNHIYREVKAPQWDEWDTKGWVKQEQAEEAEDADVKVDVRMSPAPEKWELPVTLEKKIHQPHIENFLATIAGEAELNCPADVAFQTTATILKIQEAMKNGGVAKFTPDDFTV